MRLREFFLNNKLKSCVILSSLFMILFMSINSHAQHTSVDLENNRFARPIQPPIEPESINFLGLTLGRQPFIPDCTQEGMLSSDAPCAEVKLNNFKPVYPIKYAFNSFVSVRMPDLNWVDQSLAQGSSLIYGTNETGEIIYIELSPRDIYAQEFMAHVISLLGEPQFSELMTADNQRDAPKSIRQYWVWLETANDGKIPFNVWKDLSVGGTFYFWSGLSFWAHYISNSKSHNGRGHFVIYLKTNNFLSRFYNYKHAFVYTPEQNRFARPIQPPVVSGALSFFGITMGKPITTVPACSSQIWSEIPCTQIGPPIIGHFFHDVRDKLAGYGTVFVWHPKWLDNTLLINTALKAGVDEDGNVVYLWIRIENQFKEELIDYVTRLLGEPEAQIEVDPSNQSRDIPLGATMIQWRTNEVTANYTSPFANNSNEGEFAIYLSRIMAD